MSKPTFEQLITAFNELMDELEKSRQTAQYKEDTNPKVSSECDGNCSTCYGEEPTETVGSDSDRCMTPLEILINNQINKHIEKGTFPSLDEAQAIHILDSINYRYNR